MFSKLLTVSLQALLRPALRARTARERTAAAAVLQAFCSGNIEGQSMLVATVMPVGDEASSDGRALGRPPAYLLTQSLGKSCCHVPKQGICPDAVYPKQCLDRIHCSVAGELFPMFHR